MPPYNRKMGAPPGHQNWGGNWHGPPFYNDFYQPPWAYPNNPWENNKPSWRSNNRQVRAPAPAPKPQGSTPPLIASPPPQRAPPATQVSQPPPQVPPPTSQGPPQGTNTVTSEVTSSLQQTVPCQPQQLAQVINPPQQQQTPSSPDRYEVLVAMIRSLQDSIEREREERTHEMRNIYMYVEQQRFEPPPWRGPQYGQSGTNRGRFYWPRPQPAEETPFNNNYMERCKQLNNAQRERSSLALPGAKVKIVEHVGNLCDAPQHVKVHAVASDVWMSRGIAASVAQRAGRLPKDFYLPGSGQIGDVIKQETSTMGTVWHLITKKNSPDKYYKDPETFIQGAETAFQKLAEEAIRSGLQEMALSYLCSGIDRLHRTWVLEQLHKAFKDTNITLHFYNLFESERWRGIGSLFAAPPTPPTLAPAATPVVAPAPTPTPTPATQRPPTHAARAPSPVAGPSGLCRTRSLSAAKSSAKRDASTVSSSSSSDDDFPGSSNPPFSQNDQGDDGNWEMAEGKKKKKKKHNAKKSKNQNL